MSNIIDFTKYWRQREVNKLILQGLSDYTANEIMDIEEGWLLNENHLPRYNKPELHDMTDLSPQAREALQVFPEFHMLRGYDDDYT